MDLPRCGAPTQSLLGSQQSALSFGSMPSFSSPSGIPIPLRVNPPANFLQGSQLGTLRDSGYGGTATDIPKSARNESVRGDLDTLSNATYLNHDLENCMGWSDNGALSDSSFPFLLELGLSPSVAKRDENDAAKFRCPDCDRLYDSSSKLKKHRNTHERRHKCTFPGCKRADGFASPTDLNRHMRTVHADRGKPDESCYLCPLCPNNNAKYVRRADNFRIHLMKKHKQDKDAVKNVKQYLYNPSKVQNHLLAGIEDGFALPSANEQALSRSRSAHEALNGCWSQDQVFAHFFADTSSNEGLEFLEEQNEIREDPFPMLHAWLGSSVDRPMQGRATSVAAALSADFGPGFDDLPPDFLNPAKAPALPGASLCHVADQESMKPAQLDDGPASNNLDTHVPLATTRHPLPSAPRLRASGSMAAPSSTHTRTQGGRKRASSRPIYDRPPNLLPAVFMAQDTAKTLPTRFSADASAQANTAQKKSQAKPAGGHDLPPALDPDLNDAGCDVIPGDFGDDDGDEMHVESQGQIAGDGAHAGDDGGAVEVDKSCDGKDDGQDDGSRGDEASGSMAGEGSASKQVALASEAPSAGSEEAASEAPIDTDTMTGAQVVHLLKSLMKQGRLDGALKKVGLKACVEPSPALPKPQRRKALCSAPRVAKDPPTESAKLADGDMPAAAGEAKDGSSQTTAAGPEGKLPFTCTECHKGFSLQPTLTKHMSRHDRPYKCTFAGCAKVFGSNFDWKRHEECLHIQPNRYQCKEKEHAASAGGGCGDDGNDDALCGEVLFSRQKFADHLRKKHKVTRANDTQLKVANAQMPRRCVSFWCGYCQKEFSIGGAEATDGAVSTSPLAGAAVTVVAPDGTADNADGSSGGHAGHDKENNSSSGNSGSGSGSGNGKSGSCSSGGAGVLDTKNLLQRRFNHIVNHLKEKKLRAGLQWDTSKPNLRYENGDEDKDEDELPGPSDVGTAGSALRRKRPDGGDDGDSTKDTPGDNDSSERLAKRLRA